MASCKWPAPVYRFQRSPHIVLNLCLHFVEFPQSCRIPLYAITAERCSRSFARLDDPNRGASSLAHEGFCVPARTTGIVVDSSPGFQHLRVIQCAFAICTPIVYAPIVYVLTKRVGAKRDPFPRVAHKAFSRVIHRTYCIVGWQGFP